MLDPHLLAQQMREIRLGLEVGVDASLYADREYDWFQMEQICLGLQDSVAIKQYAFKNYSHETMKQIRLAQHSFIDLQPYIQKGFRGGELEKIRLALEENLDIDHWINEEYRKEQIMEIRLGLLQGLDVSIYGNDQYNWLQMKEIRTGLENRVDVSLYTNVWYTHQQMKEIRIGLEEQLDVSSYAKLMYTYQEMKQRRKKLQKEKEETERARVEGQEWERESVSKHARLNITFYIEESGNKAYMTIQGKEKEEMDKKAILDALVEHNIKFGILRENIDEAIKKRLYGHRILVAEGKLPVAGADGYYEFFVKTQMPLIPAQLPDGSVDYVNIEAYEVVEEGQKLAEYRPAGLGVPGRNVFGEEIPATRGKECSVLHGKGFIVAPNHVTYIARRTGKFKYYQNTIIITKMLVVSNDVTGVSGKIIFDGSVSVMGSVYSGGHIEATGDVVIEDNVEAGTIIAGGSILIKRGARSKNECKLEAKGGVSGRFLRM